MSWTGGWADGAVTTGLNAVWGVMTQLGGKTNPVRVLRPNGFAVQQIDEHGVGGRPHEMHRHGEFENLVLCGPGDRCVELNV